MTARKNIFDIKQEAKRYGVELISEEYKNTKTKLSWRCPTHGEYQQTYCAFSKACGCPKCGRLRGSRKRKYTISQVTDTLAKYGDSLLDNEYKGSHTKLKMNCQKHGVFYQTYSEYLSGHRCPKCGRESTTKKQLLPISIVESVFKSAGLELLENSHNGCSKPLRCYCPKHGVVYATYNTVKRSGMCPKCGIHRSGSDNPSWQGGLTDLSKHLRGLIDPWKNECFAKAHGRCEITGKRGDLQVHHMTSVKEILEITLKETGLDVREKMSDYSDDEYKVLSEAFVRNNEKLADPIVMDKYVHQAFHVFCGGNSEPTTHKQLNLFKEFIEFYVWEGW